MRWTLVPSPYAASDADFFLREVVERGWREDTGWIFAVEHRGRYAGTVELRHDQPGRAELAFVAHPESRGRGVMERAARTLLEWGFAERDLQSVVWLAERGNWASWRLAWKLGFTLSGIQRRWLTARDAAERVDGWEGYLVRGAPMRPAHPWLAPVPLDTASSAANCRLRELRLGTAGPDGSRDTGGSSDTDSTGSTDDTARLVEACRDPEIVRWIGSIPQPYDATHARAYDLDRREAMALGSEVRWAIADESDLLTGMLSIMGIDRTLGVAEVGYWLHPQARGRGIARAAVEAAGAHAFARVEAGGLGLDLLHAQVAEGNDASLAVLQGAGFTVAGRQERLVLTRQGPAAGYRLERPIGVRVGR